MSVRLLRLAIAAILSVAFWGSQPVHAASPALDIPAWLQKHVGVGDGQIAPLVLQRARALYHRKLGEGRVTNACYLAMDATRPNSLNGRPGRRFYVICEGQQRFRAISSGHGNGRKLRLANFKNARQCAKNFSNAEGSNLTAGGSYVTAESRTSFKGFYRQGGERVPFLRTFLLFDGEGETANAREREIGGHEAVFLRWKCRFRNPTSSYADDEGYVPFGSLVNYTGGRSNGCTTWSQSNADEILRLVEGNPTTLYIYPESRDINAVAAAVGSGKKPSRAGLYWNATCLKAIRAPRFWPESTLRRIIDGWRQSLPLSMSRPLPICD